MPESNETPRVARRLAAILAADVAGYSALMVADDVRTVRDLKAHQGILLPLIGQYGGRVIDTAGDGILAEFGSVVNAVDCAVALQQVMTKRNANVEAARRMQYRVGINFGDVIYDEVRVYGDDVNIAARLEALAEPGTIYVSAKVYEGIQGKVRIACDDLGERDLKNIMRPVHVFRLRMPGAETDPILPSAEAAADKPSIAVLPFANMSGDHQQEYLADGIVDDLITALSKFRWLLVIARNSSFTYKGRAVDVRKVARELSVRYIVEGSVKKSGNRLRITAQLIDAGSGGHIWADRYDRSLSDVFEIQDEITDRIATALAPELTAAEITRAQHQHRHDLNAWDAYLRALPLMREHTQAANASAVKLLTKATALSADFSAAWARLSACRTQAAYYGWNGHADHSVVAEALEWARRAQALDPEEPLAFDALASAFQLLGENEKAEAAARRALELSPTCTAAYGTLIFSLSMLGRAEEALEVFARSERTSPRDPDRSSRLMGLACAHFMAGRYEDAIASTTEYIAVRPNWYGAYVVLAAACIQTGRGDEAQRAVQRLLELVPHFTLGRARKQPMFRQFSHAEMLFDALQKAGLPI
jgi:TolB-like protein/class 3 adenylate cyclase/Flp pilus assembly protein TadD